MFAREENKELEQFINSVLGKPQRRGHHVRELDTIKKVLDVTAGAASRSEQREISSATGTGPNASEIALDPEQERIMQERLLNEAMRRRLAEAFPSIAKHPSSHGASTGPTITSVASTAAPSVASTAAPSVISTAASSPSQTATSTPSPTPPPSSPSSPRKEKSSVVDEDIFEISELDSNKHQDAMENATHLAIKLSRQDTPKFLKDVIKTIRSMNNDFSFVMHVFKKKNITSDDFTDELKDDFANLSDALTDLKDNREGIRKSSKKLEEKLSINSGTTKERESWKNRMDAYRSLIKFLDPYIETFDKRRKRGNELIDELISRNSKTPK